MEIIIKVTLLFGLLIICLLGFMYFIVCITADRNRRQGYTNLNRTKANYVKGKPTIPPKKDWDDINIPMR